MSDADHVHVTITNDLQLCSPSLAQHDNCIAQTQLSVANQTEVQIIVQ